MPNIEKKLIIGQKYGHLTAICEAPRGKHGERRYMCRCDCGHVGNYIVYPILKGVTKNCRKCVPHSGGMPPPDLVGKTLNGWKVIAKEKVVRKESGNLYFFRCQCSRCGNESVLTAGQIYNSKSSRCHKCGPMYHFRIEGGSAYGALSDGAEFIIDTEDIAKVDQHYWFREGNGQYIVSRDGNRMHRLVLGITDPSIMIDHINRNRSDNRKANLRVATTAQNCFNHSKLSTNRTGYIGVYFSQVSQRYEVKVGYNQKRIYLGSSKDDLIYLAQMYNIAASYLFDEYVGELNDVPDPSPELVKRVIQKCEKYKKASVQAAGAFSMEGAV